MAISKMAKVMLVSHRSQITELLEALQQSGYCQILNAEKAMVSKAYPDLKHAGAKPRHIEETLTKITKAVEFLQNFDTTVAGSVSGFAPKIEIDDKKYNAVTDDGDNLLSVVDQALECQENIELLKTKIQSSEDWLIDLQPWAGLDMPLEQLADLTKASVFTGSIPVGHLAQISASLSEIGAEIETVSQTGNKTAIIAVCLTNDTAGVHKELRASDFEAISFESMIGSVAENIEKTKQKITSYQQQIETANNLANELAGRLLDVEILSDHYSNLLTRDTTGSEVPATDSAVLLEGWVKRKNYKKLEKLVSEFSASSLNEIDLIDDEQPPMEIENNAAVAPFETITRLHGMPNVGDVDPTAFLTPFFALFFGLCLTDAGYGIIMTAVFWWLTKKLQGDKKAIYMLLICSVSTIIAGALTGSWFGDSIQVMIPQSSGAFTAINGVREKIMLFDPMKSPMTFFLISIALGYIQIIFALCIGLVNNIKRRDYATAVFNYLVWLIFLNSLLVFGLSSAGMLPVYLVGICKWVAISMAAMIFWFTERKSGMAGRIGGGVFALFSTVFYFGDILSYVRIMALGMVTAGLGMAVNILVKLVMDVPYIGFILGAVFFVGGHALNMVLSILSSFVHSLRLQFVEFFPKFFVGGGTEFKPLTRTSKYVLVNQKEDS